MQLPTNVIVIIIAVSESKQDRDIWEDMAHLFPSQIRKGMKKKCHCLL